MRRLRKTTVTFVLIPVFLAVSLIPILPKPAYAASQAPPAPIPEDSLAQQPEKQEPEISINVDVRDGHLTTRVVDIWGPGRKPLVVRSLTNARSKSGVSAGPWQWNLQSDVVPKDPLNLTGDYVVREPDGNSGTYKYVGLGSNPNTYKFEKRLGSYATMEAHFSCVQLECSINLWTVFLSKGVTMKYLPNPRIDQVGQPDGLLTEIRDANGNVTTATWISFGDALQSNYIEKLTDPVGRVTTFTYQRGEVAGCIDAGQLKALGKQPAGPVTAAGCVNYYNYRVQKITDPYGRTATYTYTSDNLTSVLNAAGYTTRYDYGGIFPGLLTGVTDARGNKTTSGTSSTSGKSSASWRRMGRRRAIPTWTTRRRR